MRTQDETRDDYRVVQTECRTGWQVLRPDGRVVPHSTRRRREAAQEVADDLNETPLAEDSRP